MSESVRNINFEDEFDFQTSRSSGPGGQHANKTETRVTLRFDVNASAHLSEVQKKRIFEKLGNAINNEGELLISSQESRSQPQNKEICIARFYDMISKALKKPKKRKYTKPTRASRKRRLDEKRQHSEKKARRQKPDL